MSIFGGTHAFLRLTFVANIDGPLRVLKCFGGAKRLMVIPFRLRDQHLLMLPFHQQQISLANLSFSTFFRLVGALLHYCVAIHQRREQKIVARSVPSSQPHQWLSRTT